MCHVISEGVLVWGKVSDLFLGLLHYWSVSVGYVDIARRVRVSIGDAE